MKNENKNMKIKYFKQYEMILDELASSLKYMLYPKAHVSMISAKKLLLSVFWKFHIIDFLPSYILLPMSVFYCTGTKLVFFACKDI